MFRKRLITAALAITFSVSASASIQSEMQSWFDEMGAYGNVTGPQVVQGQTTTVYTGGGMYMRTPIRNYQLASIAPPSIRGGCGGIDLFAGSFSFINSEQLTALLRNVANNAVGYAFMMAVKSISPDLADLLQYLQDQLSKINNMNLNSCQMAEGITTATLGPLLSDKKEQANAQGTGSLLSNLWPDSFQSFDSWRSDKDAKKQARQQAASADANLKEILEPGNVVWKALQKSNAPEELRELMMSLIGTIIIVPTGKPGNENGDQTLWRYVGPTGIKFSDFVGPPELETKKDVTLLKCGSDVDCMNPTATSNQSIASLSWYVHQTMKKAVDNIDGRSLQNFRGIDYAVYMNTSVPVWRLVNIATMSNTSDIVTDHYAQVIATELAYNWFTEMVRTLQKALSNNTTAQSQDVVEASKKLDEQIADVRKLAASEYIARHQQALSVAEMQRSVQWLHETMLRAMPVDVQKSLQTFNY
jgi:conjugative transfer pilus assembly protein TraH